MVVRGRMLDSREPSSCRRLKPVRTKPSLAASGHRGFFRKLGFSITASLCCYAAGNDLEAEPIWLDAHYPYAIIEHQLKDVFFDFGSNVGVPVQVSSEVEGWARGPLASGSARTFLDRLSDTYRLDWYFDGKVLHISTDSEAGERLVNIRGIRPESIERSLRSLDLADPRYPLRVSQQQNVAIVAGPPRYVALVETAIDALRPRPKRAVEVIRGRGS